jgi:hypothetical protein
VSYPGCFDPGEIIPYVTLIEWEAGKAPESVWVKWQGENSMPLPGIEPWFSNHPVHSLVSIMTEQPDCHCIGKYVGNNNLWPLTFT